jgi:hypothetical protein
MPEGGILDDVVKLQIWEEFVNLRRKVRFPPKIQEFKSKPDGAKFTGLIKTDALAVSITIGPQTTKGSSRSKKRNRDEQAGILDSM